MTRVPSSQRGKATYGHIVKSATNLFRIKGYQEVSIAGICKEAGVGNSTFYQYFSAKEDVLREIVEDLITLIGDSVERSIGSSSLGRSERLRVFLKDFFETIYENIDGYGVFRNAEFINPEISSEFHERMFEIFSRSLFPELKDEVSKRARYMFIVGAAHFMVTEYGIYKGIKPSEEVKETLFDFLYNGLDPDDYRQSNSIFALLEPIEPETEFMSRGSMTHRKILDAAEDRFGEKGYSHAKISEISNTAGVGLGTFYVHFDSKIESLRELVLRTLEGLKGNLRRYMSRFSDRRDAEIAGYTGFCDFFRRHKNMYSIVREAEFVAPDMASFYYSNISRSYARPLERAFENGEYRRMKIEPLSYALMGIGHLMGQYLIVQRDAEMDECVSYIREMARLVLHGLKEFTEVEDGVR